MCGECSRHGRYPKYLQIFTRGSLKGTGPLEGIGIQGKLILKSIGLIWLKIGTSNILL